MRHDASPTYGLIIALIAGAIAAWRGRSGGAYGAFSCIAFFLLWDILPQPFSPTAYYAVGLTMLTLNAIMQGAIWGGLWGFAGGLIGKRIRGRNAGDPAIALAKHLNYVPAINQDPDGQDKMNSAADKSVVDSPGRSALRDSPRQS